MAKINVPILNERKLIRKWEMKRDKKGRFTSGVVIPKISGTARILPKKVMVGEDYKPVDTCIHNPNPSVRPSFNLSKDNLSILNGIANKKLIENRKNLATDLMNDIVATVAQVGSINTKIWNKGIKEIALKNIISLGVDELADIFNPTRLTKGEMQRLKDKIALHLEKQKKESTEIKDIKDIAIDIPMDSTLQWLKNR